MLYEIAHVIKERFGFLWDTIEWGNAEVFALMHRGEMKRIPELLAECSGRYQLRLATREDVELMKAFFEAQPEEAFRFFQPHEFNEKGIRKVVANKSFLTFLAIANDNDDDTPRYDDPSINHKPSSINHQIVGYFFLRCFVNGKAFRGKMVDKDHQGRGIAKLMGVAMTKVATTLGVRMFGSISPENYASLASAKASNEVKIHKTLENGYYYIAFLPKSCDNTNSGEVILELQIISLSIGQYVEPYKLAA